ncbi:type IV secretory system conjugative DNA transfer family protein, partial [Aulosira sp. FACHB-615]|uniref:type IV secretory system conjugative DNA transfer family protein n=1 Tax=Aulosira sp. FACHB-615 TaxID=2692777 RepID=UPI0019C453C0
MAELHPSQVHLYLKMYHNANKASWLCWVVCVLVLCAAVDIRQKQLKPWLLMGATAALFGGKHLRESAKQLNLMLGNIDQASKLNFQALAKTQTQPTAQLTLNIAADTNWQPPNLITDPVEYIQKKQKHVALVGGTGDGKSTFTQYLSSKIGGRVVVYDSDAKPDDWNWLDQKDVIGRKGNFKAIDTAMGNDLTTLEELVELRGDGGDNAIIGRDRFLIAEEFPLLVDECDNAARWFKKHLKRGRRYKQFVLAIAQNDTAENYGLQGDKETLYSCCCLVRLGQFARDYARTVLKNPQLEQWLKAGGKKRFMVDDVPCELDLSNWSMGGGALVQISSRGNEADNSPQIDLNEFEQFI